MTTSVRIAWFKVYYPAAFYASYFTTKLSDFDGEVMVKGVEEITKRIKLINEKEDATKKEKDEVTVLQVALEMYARGLSFKRVDLKHSHFSKFKIYNGQILLPFQSLSGVGETVAKSISEEAKKGEFLSVEDLMKKTGATKAVIEALQEHGVLHGLAQSNQLSIMDMLDK